MSESESKRVPWHRSRCFRALLVVVALGVGTACVSLPPEPGGFERADPDATVERLLATCRPQNPALGLRLTPVENDDDWTRFRFRAETFSELAGDFKAIEGEYYRAATGGSRPLVVCSPILGGAATGYLVCHLFSKAACARGYSTIFLYQDDRILTTQRDGFGLEALLRELTRDTIKILDLFVRRSDVDAERLASLGISLGAIRNVLLVAAEPRLRANILCIGGGGLAEILASSREPGVLSWRRRRSDRELLAPGAVVQEIDQRLAARPLLAARAIDPSRVFLMLARFDDKVALRFGERLRRGLGGPATRVVPGGHYTGMLFAPFVLGDALDWVEARVVVRCGGCQPA